MVVPGGRGLISKSVSWPFFSKMQLFMLNKYTMLHYTAINRRLMIIIIITIHEKCALPISWFLFDGKAKKHTCTRTRNSLTENKNGHETDLEMSFWHIDDTNLHKKNAANPARIVVGSGTWVNKSKIAMFMIMLTIIFSSWLLHSICHETDLEMSFWHIDDTNLHKKRCKSSQNSGLTRNLGKNIKNNDFSCKKKS